MIRLETACVIVGLFIAFGRNKLFVLLYFAMEFKLKGVS